MDQPAPRATTPAVEIIETPALGDRSYLVHDGAVAVVVDPQRDIDRVTALLDARGLRLAHVLETHVHNDYVTGGPQLATETGAGYVLPAGSGASVAHEAVADGEVWTAGRLTVTALATPGHTAHHTSYAVALDGGAPTAVFTGGSMLFGTAGRTDLTGLQHARRLAAAQQRSLRRLVELLPREVDVLPTHGFGSFCAAGPSSGTSSTIGDQARDNPALHLSEADYVAAMVDGLGPVPSWYARMAPVNRRGPAPVDLSMPPLLDDAALGERLAGGGWVVDLRSRREFARAHLRLARSFELSGAFLAHLGWLLPPGEEPTLLAPGPGPILAARRELARLGVDDVTAAIWRPPPAGTPAVRPAAGLAVDSYPLATFADLAPVVGRPDVTVLDVRQGAERAGGTVAGALGIPLHELPQRLEEVPRHGEVWVHCASGYRAGAAASLLARTGRRVVHVDDAFEASAAVRRAA